VERNCLYDKKKSSQKTLARGREERNRTPTFSGSRGIKEKTVETFLSIAGDRRKEEGGDMKLGREIWVGLRGIDGFATKKLGEGAGTQQLG